MLPRPSKLSLLALSILSLSGTAGYAASGDWLTDGDSQANSTYNDQNWLQAQSPDYVFPLSPRATVGVTGHTNAPSGKVKRKLYGQGDVMVPMYGNQNAILFLDSEGKYGGDNGALASLGAGVRSVTGSGNNLMGFYLFGDFDRTADSNNFWVLNPGIEWMTSTLDVHFNGYFPVSKKQKINATVTSQQLGLGQQLYFQGHNEFNQLYDLVEEVGNGVDGELGVTFPNWHNLRVFGGGYHYQIKNASNITGVQGGLQYPLNQYFTVSIQDSYDKVSKNTAALTLGFTIGGLSKEGFPDVRNRLLDSIPRHLGTLYTGSGIPTQHATVASPQGLLLSNNVWFFSPTGTGFDASQGTGNCTFEHPCNIFNQPTIDGINNLSKNAQMYFASGTYTNPNAGTGYTIHNGQSLWGRTADFKNAASGSQVPVINDTLFLQGNNSVNNLHINGNTTVSANGDDTRSGIVVSAAATGSVNINDSVVSVSADGLAGVDAVGLNILSNGATVNVNSTTINATASNGSGLATGINNAGANTVNVNDSVVAAIGQNNLDDVNGIINSGGGVLSVTNSTVSAANSGNANNEVNGILNNANGTLHVENSTINATSTGGASGVNGIANEGAHANVSLNNAKINVTLSNTNAKGFGVWNVNGATADINNTSITANGVNSGDIFGINVGTNATVNLSNSTVTASANGGAADFVNGILVNGNNGVVNISGSSITASGLNGVTAQGISNSGAGGVVNYQNSTITANGAGATAISTGGGNTTNNQGGNVCMVNGVAVACPAAP